MARVMAKAANMGGDKRPAGGRKTAPVERERGGPARAIADLIPAIGGAAFRKFGFIQASLVTRWRDIVGDRLADITEPAMIRFPVGQKAGGTLHLTISGAHAPMLQHVEPDLIAAVNRFFGYAAISRVKMTQGQVSPAPRPVQPAAISRAVPAELGDSLRAVTDPELRTVLERMAAGLGQKDNDGRPRLPKIS